MSGKKSKQKTAASQKIIDLKSEDQSRQEVSDTRDQRRLAILGFAFLGLLMGFLWGANSVIDTVNSASPLIQAAKTSAAVASAAADWDKGLFFGFFGTIMGASFGYSIFLDTKVMFTSWGIGAAGLIIGAFMGSPAVSLIGWCIGYGAVIFTCAKKHFGAAYKQISSQRAK